MGIHMNRVAEGKPRQCMNCYKADLETKRKAQPPKTPKDSRSDCKLHGHIQEAIDLYNAGWSTYQIAKRYGLDVANVFRILQLRNVKLRSQPDSVRLCFAQGRHNTARGSRSAQWKGGRCHHSEGYILLKHPNHPHTNSQGYVPEHILVAEKKYGRQLQSNEVAHHINHDRADNRSENLQIMTIAEHRHLHGREGGYAKQANKLKRLASGK